MTRSSDITNRRTIVALSNETIITELFKSLKYLMTQSIGCNSYSTSLKRTALDMLH